MSKHEVRLILKPRYVAADGVGPMFDDMVFRYDSARDAELVSDALIKAKGYSYVEVECAHVDDGVKTGSYSLTRDEAIGHGWGEEVIKEAEGYYETMLDKHFWIDLDDEEKVSYFIRAKAQMDSNDKELPYCCHEHKCNH